MFECPYHRWTFEADGRLRTIPKQGEGYCPGFRREDFPLLRVRSAILKGLIFVTFSEDAPPLGDYLEEASQTLASIMGGDGRLHLIGYQKVRFQSNWKVYNDSDGYHAALLHGAFRMLNWQGGKGTQNVTASRGHVAATSEIALPSDGGRRLLKDPSLIEFKAVVDAIRAVGPDRAAVAAYIRGKQQFAGIQGVEFKRTRSGNGYGVSPDQLIIATIKDGKFAFAGYLKDSLDRVGLTPAVIEQLMREESILVD